MTQETPQARTTPARRTLLRFFTPEAIEQCLKITALGGVAAFLLGSIVPANMRNRELQDQLERIQLENRVLQEQCRLAEREYHALQNDPQYIERIIREHNNRLAPGEYKLGTEK